MIIEHRHIKKLKEKDERSFEIVYQLTKKGVYSIAFSVVRNHMAAEDVMQDAYLKMMQNIDQYQSHTNFYNWLLTLTKNLAIDYYRKEKRKTTIDVVDYEENLKSHDDLPDEKTKVDLMLEQLSEEERLVVLLKVVDDMKYKDIALLMDKPMGTIQYIYSEAIKKLRQNEG